MRNATLEKRRAAPAGRPQHNTNPTAKAIVIQALSTAKVRHGFCGALLGAGGGIVAHNFVVALAALIIRGAS